MHESVAVAPLALRHAVEEQSGRYPDDGEVLYRLLAFLETKRPMMREIRDSVCEFYGLEPGELDSRSRFADVSFSRQMFCFLAYKHTRFSMQQIGWQVGVRNHTTVLHAIRKIERWVIFRPLVADDVDLLRMRISEKVLLRWSQGRG
jgi:chromosomal replication initiation ATPase DnaA